MPHKIRRSGVARQDQADIWLFIATNNIQAADRQMDRLNDAFYLLADYPEAGSIRPEHLDLRLYPVDQYNIFYRVTPDAVEIVRVLHAARNAAAELEGQ